MSPEIKNDYGGGLSKSLSVRGEGRGDYFDFDSNERKNNRRARMKAVRCDGYGVMYSYVAGYFASSPGRPVVQVYGMNSYV